MLIITAIAATVATGASAAFSYKRQMTKYASERTDPVTWANEYRANNGPKSIADEELTEMEKTIDLLTQQIEQLCETKKTEKKGSKKATETPAPETSKTEGKQ